MHADGDKSNTNKIIYQYFFLAKPKCLSYSISIECVLYAYRDGDNNNNNNNSSNSSDNNKKYERKRETKKKTAKNTVNVKLIRQVILHNIVSVAFVQKKKKTHTTTNTDVHESIFLLAYVHDTVQHNYRPKHSHANANTERKHTQTRRLMHTQMPFSLIQSDMWLKIDP